MILKRAYPEIRNVMKFTRMFPIFTAVFAEPNRTKINITNVIYMQLRRAKRKEKKLISQLQESLKMGLIK